MTSHRANRVAEEIKKETIQMIRDQLKDPRIGFVTVTSVEVTPDIRYARIYVSILGNDEEKKGTMEALLKSQGFIRSELGKRMRLRYTPEISFHIDTSIEHGARIMELLQEVKGREKKDE